MKIFSRLLSICIYIQAKFTNAKVWQISIHFWPLFSFKKIPTKENLYTSKSHTCKYPNSRKLRAKIPRVRVYMIYACCCEGTYNT